MIDVNLEALQNQSESAKKKRRQQNLIHTHLQKWFI